MSEQVISEIMDKTLPDTFTRFDSLSEQFSSF